MQEGMKRRVLESTRLFLKKRTNVRDIAKEMHCSKSTVHKDLSERLKELDLVLYEEVQALFTINKEEKHFRGGESTKKKYAALK